LGKRNRSPEEIIREREPVRNISVGKDVAQVIYCPRFTKMPS
jgi:hypothetical protein